MITHINCIKGVGKFNSCTASSITLTDKVLIFGKNITGKSTLTSIFSSLKANNVDLLIGRKTFGYNVNQEIVIKTEGDTYVFKDNKWNKYIDCIEIFDTKFICENVCNTEEISYDQQSNLNNFILGKTGHLLVDEIKEITDKITEFGTKKSTLTKTFFNPLIEDDIDLDFFLKLPETKNIDKLIENQNKKITQIKNKKNLIKSIDDSFFRFDFEKYEDILTKKVVVDLSQIDSHIKKHFEDISRGKQFIQDGLPFVKENCCPFCSQELGKSARNLIEDYKQIFSKEFSTLQKNIITVIEEFLPINLEDKIKKELLSFEKFGVTINLSDDKITELVNSKKSINDKFEKKKLDITYDVDLSSNHNWSQLKTTFSKIVAMLDSKRKEVELNSDINAEEKKLKNLQLRQRRYEKEVSEKIKKYNSYTTDIDALTTKRNKKQEELDNYAEVLFKNCQNKINQYLKELNSNFVLDGFSHLKKLRGQNESIFAINFDSQYKVNIYEREHCKPNFGNTLSESDKRTLAFAFFLSKLSMDEDLDKKTIIFDDPISSFDRERKRKTCHLLLDIECKGKKPNQIIILTHQEDFLKALARNLDNFGERYTVR